MLAGRAAPAQPATQATVVIKMHVSHGSRRIVADPYLGLHQLLSADCVWPVTALACPPVARPTSPVLPKVSSTMLPSIDR